MPKIKFDKTKDFTQVMSSHASGGGIAYGQVAQDGVYRYFNAEGACVDYETGEILNLTYKTPKAKPETTEVVTMSGGEATVRQVEAPPPAPEIDEKTELLKWLKKEEGAETNWARIKKYAKEVLFVAYANKEELVAGAIEQGLITADEVKVDL